jgi:glycosyltransferase involved in cell wall biosynthesis
MKTIVIVSDVITTQQINGVGTWLIHTKSELEKMGLQVFLLDASLFSYTLPLPSYPEIQLVVSTRSSIEGRLREINPDYIHIATEGTLGLLARSACLKNSWKFTTSYHTRFPEYVFVRTNMQVLKYITYTYMRWFHSRAEKTIVTTVSLQHELEHSHFKNLAVVPLGVDLTLFKKNKEAAPSVSMSTLKKPFFIYMGRLAIEKNINAFLECKLPGSKIVVGDGPERKKIRKKIYSKCTLYRL